MVAAVSRFRQGVVIALLALAILRITHNGDYTRYVKASLRPYLYISGGLLLVLGILSIVSRPRKEAGHEGHGHGLRGPRIGWLLLVPVFAILLITPPALGSFAVHLSAGLVDSRGQSALGPLPPGSPLELPLTDYARRAVDGQTLAGRTVRLTGFVTPGAGGVWYVTRYVIVCCAADAQAVGARVLNIAPPDRDRWVAVTGTWRPSTDGTPTISASRVDGVDAPQDPYL